MLWVCVHLRRLSSRVWCEGGLDAHTFTFIIEWWKNNDRLFLLYCANLKNQLE